MISSDDIMTSSEASTAGTARIPRRCGGVVGRRDQENGRRSGCRSQGYVNMVSLVDCAFTTLTNASAAVDSSLGEIVPRLLKRFSSREGYKLYDDSLPTRTASRLLYTQPSISSATQSAAPCRCLHSEAASRTQHPYRYHQQHRCPHACVAAGPGRCFSTLIDPACRCRH